MYKITVMDTETYIPSVVDLVEREIEIMDVSKDKLYTIFWEVFLSNDQKRISGFFW